MSTNAKFAHTIEEWEGTGFVPGLAGVLFADDFDLATPARQAEAAVASPPAITQEDLAAARAAGFAAGHAAAAAERDHATATATQHACAALAAACASAPEAARRACEQAAETAAHDLLQTLAAILPELCAEHGPREAAALAAALLPSLAHGVNDRDTPLTIAADAATIEAVREILARQPAPLAQAARLETVAAMAPGDLALRWQDGAATRDTGRLLRALAEALAPLGIVVTLPAAPSPTAEPRPTPPKAEAPPARAKTPVRELVDV